MPCGGAALSAATVAVARVRRVRVRRIVAQHAILGVVAQRAVNLKRYVALIAVGERHHRAPRRDGRAVHREIRYLVRRSILDGRLRQWLR